MKAKRKKIDADDKDLPWIQRQFIRLITKKIIKKLNLMNLKGSPKTSTVGWLALVGAIITAVAIPVLDGNPETVIDWGTAIEAAKNAGIMLPIWLIGIFARDNDKTSEDIKRASR